MSDHTDVFLSYSHNDRDAAVNLRAQLDRFGLSVFRDAENIREGDLWLDRLQDAVDGCGAFVVLVGRDGVGRWIGAETRAALSRYFGPDDDALRLPIFPILLGETKAGMLPPFLRLFQGTTWNGTDPLPERLLGQIRDRAIVDNEAVAFEGCPFVGLDAFRMDQAHLFFGRQKETLDALNCFFDVRPGNPSVRWLEINGNSGSGKSSLMNAGLLPLVDEGWLWRPHKHFTAWRRIGPLMPGAHPVEMLAEHLARAFAKKMDGVCEDLRAGDRALARLLRGNKPGEETAFLLAIDQFEELFTFADPDEREQFDRLLAAALEDADCPLVVISTVRADFLDRFEDLPRLVAVRNRLGRPWTLPPIGAEGLREVIAGPARLAGLDVSAVKEAMVADAGDEPGALPLVENALNWLWEQRSENRLSGKLFTDQGRLAGILSRGADGLIDGLGPKDRDRALDLLFRLVKVDPEIRRHTRRRIPLAEAVAVAGGGERGRALVTRLAGERARDGGTAQGPLRLITVTEETAGGEGTETDGRWVNLIHETLIRSKGVDAEGKPQPFWPTLWEYIERHKDRAARCERLQLMAGEWKQRRGFARLFGLTGLAGFFRFRGLAAPGSIEQRYLRWSKGSVLVQAVFLAVIVGVGAVFGESIYWAEAHNLPLDIAVKRFAYSMGLKPPTPALQPISQGSFVMGSPESKVWRGDNEGPQRLVRIRPFEIGKYEVTFDEWDACVADGGCNAIYPDDQDWGRGARPVIKVSWDDTQVFLEWLSRKIGYQCRLPTEAEWEYAARAGTTTQYAFGDEIGEKDANFAFTIGKTTTVGSYPANAWGLRDMHGNAWEWVEDCWHETYDGAPEDGRAWLEGKGGNCGFRVSRGGSWNDNQVNARSAFRVGFDPDARNYYYGFRVVCSAPSLGTDH